MNEAVKQKALVPKLRFPEFQGEWVDTRIGEICPFQRGFDLPSYEMMEGPVPVIYSNGVGGTHARGMALGPGIVTGRSGTIGKTNYIASGPYWPHNTTLWVTAFNNCDSLFAFYLLHSFEIGRYGTGSGVPTLNRNTLHELRIAVPLTLDEQRKVADCLESLDELIAAETEKLEALKRHKKGLLQQLFPAEGETTPRLRFLGYTSPWRAVALTGLLSESPTYGLNAPATEYRPDLPLYLRITDIDEEGQYIAKGRVSVAQTVTSADYLQQGDIVVARTGASVGKSYFCDGRDGPFVYAGFLIRLRADARKLLPQLLAQWFRTNEYWRWVTLTCTRSGQPGINATEYGGATLPLPTGALAIDEQLEIASCLSAEDTAIDFLREKLEGLRLHKAGLVQQLFPPIEEIDNAAIQ